MWRGPDTLGDVNRLFQIRDGFAWWLPILTAALGALIAVGVSQSTVAAWDADVHLWARDGERATEYADLLSDPSLHHAAAAGMMATEDGQATLDAVAVELNQTLIRLTVRSSTRADAETLAVALAGTAAAEASDRFGPDGLFVLGLVQPGARQVMPSTELTAAWASAVGLLGGLILASVLARPARASRSTLGRIGRIGLRPLAVVPNESEAAVPSDQDPLDGEASGLFAAIKGCVGVVALTPLDAESGAPSTLTRTAQALATEGRRVIWLDSRRPAFEVEYSAPPTWLSGAPWLAVDRWQLIRRASANLARSDREAHVLLLTDPLDDPSTQPVVETASGVILIARSDASDAELERARQQLVQASLLGVVLTQAQQSELRDFELAQMVD